MSARPHLRDTTAPSASRRALELQFEEFERARVAKEEAEARLAGFADTLQVLINSLPATERAHYERRLASAELGPVVDARGSPTFTNVVALFAKDQRPEWSVALVHQALEERGIQAEMKAVANAVAYLARTGRLQRISRGRYVVRGLGVGIEVEETGYDGVSRLTEHDT